MDNSTSSKKDQISTNVSNNEQKLKEQFDMCNDIEFRFMSLDNNSRILLVYIDGFCDTKTLDEAVLKPLIFEAT